MIRAIIFDLDGTLVQTEKLKALSYARAAVALRPPALEEEEVAVAAGMHCIAVATPFTREHLHEQEVLAGQWVVDEPARLLATVDRLLAREGTAGGG